MRFASLNLIRYGGFSERSYVFAPSSQDLQLFHGANEAGKSTTLSAVGDLLYGFPNLKAQDWRFDAAQLRVGACVEQDGEQLSMIRKRGRSQTLLAEDDATPLDENRLLRWLGGVDRAAFERMWSLDHQRLRLGGESMARFEGDLGQQLLAAGFGLENVQTVLDALEAEAGALWKKNGRGTRLNDLRNRLADARSRLTKAEKERDDWARLTGEARALEEQNGAVEDALATMLGERARLERLRRIRNDLLRLGGLDETLASRPALRFTVDEQNRFSAFLRNWTEAGQKVAEAERFHEGLLALRAGCQPDLALIAQQEAILAFRARFDALASSRNEQDDVAALDTLQARLLAAGQEGNPQDILARLPGETLLARLLPLAQEHAALNQREAAWRRDDEAARERLAVAEARIGSDETLPLRPLQVAMQQAEALGDLDASLIALERRIAEAERHEAQTLRDLLPWKGDAEALGTMAVPDQDFLSERRDTWRVREKELADTEIERRTLSEEAERLALDKAQLEQRDVVSRAALDQARMERDRLFSQCFASSEMHLASEEVREIFLQAQHHADHLADRRYEAAEDSARLTQIDLALERNALRHTQTQARLAGLASARRAAMQEFAVEQTRRGLPVLSPDRLPSWLTLRQQALDAACALAGLRDEHARMRARRETAIAALGALTQDGTPAPKAFSSNLAETLIEARERLREREQQAERLAERAQELELARRSVEAEHRKGASIAATRAILQERWSTLLPETPIWSPEAVQDLRQNRRDAAALQSGRDTLFARREALATLDKEFRDFTALLGKAESLAPLPCPQALAGLVDALIRARSDKDQADQQDARLKESAAAQDRARNALNDATALFAPYAARLGFDEIDSMRVALEAEMAHQRTLDERKRLERQILEQADGLSLDALQEQARAMEPAALDARLAALDAEQKTLEQQRNTALQRGGEIRQSLHDIEKAEGALEAAFDIESCRVEMAEAAEQWAEARIQTLLLNHVARRQRLENTNPLLQAAEALFTSLTCGRYQKLVIADDGKGPELAALTEAALSQDEKFIRPAAMSEGTRDQLFLSLRLAALEQARARGVTLPFLADDLFITFDEQRAEAGFATLSRIASRHQVLFFTHHAHLADLAEKFGAARHSE